MTQKLKILGPYTPEHEGPFCTRGKVPVEIAIKKDRHGKILGYRGDDKDLTVWEANGQFDHTRMSDTAYDLMNAEEVPQPREFWIVGVSACMSLDKAEDLVRRCGRFNPSIIHVREVLPGEGE